MQALIIVDMQMDMQYRMDRGRDHVNAEAPARVASLAAAFRRQGRAVIHVRHRDDNPASPFHGDAPGYPPMPCAQAQDGESVFLKHTSSGFAGTGLEDYLRQKDITNVVVVGAVAEFCVHSTVRAGADLGFGMTVVSDAVIGFDMPADNLSARMVFDVTMALLKSDFAMVVETAQVLGALDGDA